jgi:DNA polymerase-1
VFLSRDYSNLELRVLAIIAQDEESMRIFAEGKNVHDENTKVLWQTDKDDPLWDVKRKATKTDRFGTNYGGSERGIFEKVAMQCPEAGLTFAQFQASHQLYAKLHQGEEEWRKKIIQQVQSTQKVRNAFGRQRTFRGSMQEIRREAVNFPIQSTAADIINEAFIKIDAMIQQLGLKTQIVLQVHDQLVLECPYNELSLMLTVTRDYMEAPVVFNLVPGEHAFPTDASIGARWSQLIKADTWLERFDSLLK